MYRRQVEKEANVVPLVDEEPTATEKILGAGMVLVALAGLTLVIIRANPVSVCFGGVVLAVFVFVGLRMFRRRSVGLDLDAGELVEQVRWGPRRTEKRIDFDRLAKVEVSVSGAGLSRSYSVDLEVLFAGPFHLTRTRQYGHALEIAQSIARHLGLPIEDHVK